MKLSNSEENLNRREEKRVAMYGGDIEFVVRKTSLDRSWTGFDAAIYDTSGGFAETSPYANHTVSMHIGTPISATCRFDGEVHRRLQVPGDIAVVAAGHCGAWVDEGSTTVLIVNVTPSLIRSAAEGMSLDPDRVGIQSHLHLKDPQVEHLGWALKAELETDEPVGRLYADSLGLALAAHLLRRYALVEPRRLASGLSKRRLQRVHDYIHDHLSRDLTLAELAGIANMSPSHFKVLFKRSVGVPVHQYVIRSRVECATDLLLHSKLRLCDVALQAGFADQSHMARCIRRVTGMSPAALKREGS